MDLKVRLILNDHGQTVTEAMPSTPVEVVGWRDTPSAGDEVIQVETEVNSTDLLVNLTLSLPQSHQGNSPYCLLYNSVGVSLENLVLDQLINPSLIFFSILIICLLDIVLIW